MSNRDRDYAPARHPDAANEVKNGALRELAGRIKKLSYSDMMELSNVLANTLPTDTGVSPPAAIAEALLKAATALESA